MVGERGPELVHLPRGSRVTPNSQLGAQQVHVTVGVSDRGELRAYVQRVSGATAGAAVQAYDGRLADRVAGITATRGSGGEGRAAARRRHGWEPWFPAVRRLRLFSARAAA
jgi:hypothetical protein